MEKIILHLDDDPDQLSLIRTICTDQLSYKYEGFVDCEGCLHYLKDNKVDLLIVDLNLKEGAGAGFSVIKAVKKKFHDLFPIIVLSRRGDPNDVTYSLDLGVDDYLIKPIDLDLFTDKIKSLLTPSDLSKFPFYNFKKKKTGTITINVNPVKLDEMYFYADSESYFVKNTAVELSHPLLEKIFNEPKIKFRIHECNLNESDSRYLLKLIKWDADDSYFEKINNYLAGNAI